MKRCMIVDDSSVIRKVAKRILASRDVTILEAASAAEALRYCRMDMPELIIADITLPDMATPDFIREAIAIRGRVKPVVTVLLHELDLPLIMRCRRAGARSHLLKPFTRPQLLARFSEIEAAEIANAA